MSSPFSPGTKFGRYEIHSQLGAGGMGEVYLAEDTKLKRKVAIKFLPPGSIASEQANRRLLREARAAATLDHPNICAIHEVGEENGVNFIVMQNVEGETLEARMKRKPLDLSESLSVASQVADALAEAHAHGTIHRDIKPSNIMITARGAVKVMDFGLAKLVQQAGVVKSEAETEALLSTPGAIIGTVPYMSPEQVRGEALDGRSDIFSFGVVLYEMVSGQQPFASNSSAATASAILTHEPSPLARFTREIPIELERIVSKTLRKDSDARYQTAKDLLIDLRSLRDELQFAARLGRSSAPDLSRDESFAANSPTALGATFEQPAQTAFEDKKTTRGEREERLVAASWKKAISRRALVILAAFIVLAVAVWVFWRNANVKWARNQIPRIEELAQAGRYFEAYDLASGVQQYLPNDATITRLMPTISDTLSVTTDPGGARVYLKRFLPDEKGNFPPRELVGTTPINNLRIPRGQYILYIERNGKAQTERTVSGTIMRAGKARVIPSPLSVQQKLIEADKMPERMAFVPGGDYRLVAWARPTDARVRLDDFFIDKYEVSNQEYKEFINAGGYLKKQYWKYPFVKDGKTVPWEEAIDEFKDRTGLPGPRSWSNRNFLEGKAEHPVTDISWYEAAAYAAFRGKQLPTIFQWEKAARNGNVSPFGNYMPWGIFYPGDTLDYRANFRNNGTLPVNSSEFGMSPFGGYNMAGNVSEWSLNETSEGFIATGGAWGDPTYTFAQYGTFPGFYGSNKLGFRCALNASNATGEQGAMRIEINEEIPVYAPSSEVSFNNWLNYYRYDKMPLDPQIVEVKDTDEWRREKITFNGADGERAIAYLYLPKNFPGPLQVIHFVPPSDVESGLRPLPQAMEDMLGPFIKSGRAAFGVVIKGYIERLRPEGYTEPANTTVEYREKIVNWVTDLRRGLDYLETRNDVDASRIAFFGPSSGARMGLILAAVENRYASVFLLGSGVRKPYAQWIAEANIINFAPHIRAPKLMVHGRYDESLSLKTEAEPLYKLLRGPKRIVLYDGGHIPPFEFLVTTMNSWLDETLGPVKRGQ
jgi:serine/threonine protein kinase/formylglycine-generating enzyme required for sulfatase activity/predicted esterase